jgi:hypothetical protein
MKLAQTPFAADLRLSEPGPAHNPFAAHRPTIDRLQRSCW